jgi:hypothetical protein
LERRVLERKVNVYSSDMGEWILIDAGFDSVALKVLSPVGLGRGEDIRKH